MSNVTIPAEQKGLADRHLDELFELVEALDASSTDVCVDCGLPLGGLLGVFEWGIVHGQGECSACKFPYVYYHYHEVEPREELLLCAWVPNAAIPESPQAACKEGSDA